MTEKEKLQLAKKYIDYLARGFNPLDESPVNNDDVVRNIRISKCLLYVSDVLGEVIDKGLSEERKFSYKKESKEVKEEFTVGYEERERFIFSAKPLTVSEIANGISSLIDAEKVKPLKATVINEWLVQNGFLREEESYNGKTNKVVTEEGYSIGINDVEKISQNGFPYKRIIYSIESQQFIIDNLDSIIEFNQMRSSIKKTEKLERRISKNRNNYTDKILDEVICDLHSAGATYDDIAIATDQDAGFILKRMKELNLV